MTPITLTASAGRTALVVQARDEEGHAARIEMAVDSRLSGESLAGALTFIGLHEARWIRELHSVDALRTWVARHAEAIDWNPRTWTAVELALLKVFAQQSSQSLQQLLDVPEQGPLPPVTAVLPENAPYLFDQHLMRSICDGYRDYKLSLTGIQAVDQSHIDALEAGRIAPSHTRAQATQLWTDPREAVEYLARLNYPFWALEEPLAPGAYGDLAHMAYQLDTRIVLDDSLCRASQLRRLGAESTRWIALLRVGKLGGVIRALDFIATARRLGIPMIAGDCTRDGPGAAEISSLLMAAAQDLLLAREYEAPGAAIHDIHSIASGSRCA